MRNYFLLLFCLVCSWTVNAQQEVFEQANQSYEKGQYVEAIGSYEESIVAGYTSDELLYNLGNAYYQNKEIGKAILNYERALKLNPSFKDAGYNLEIAKEKIKNDIVSLPPFFLNKWFKGIRNQMSSTAWGILFILFLLATTAAFGIWILSKERSKKKKGFILIFPLLLFALLFFALGSSKKSYELHSSQAIIIVDQTTLKHAPDKVADDVLVIYEGLKVKIIQELSDWVEIELPDKERGWLEKKVMTEI
jgi:tetratricopeptide (TPR) repeat protein